MTTTPQGVREMLASGTYRVVADGQLFSFPASIDERRDAEALLRWLAKHRDDPRHGAWIWLGASGEKRSEGDP